MELSAKDLSFVVQGPIFSDANAKNGLTTAECLKSIRTYFPESPIILSTYEGSSTDQLEFDELVLNQDPGALTLLTGSSYESRVSNINRLLETSRSGMEKVKTPYACKTRTDLLFCNSNLLRLRRVFQEKERILIPNLYTRHGGIQQNFCFHFSDVLILGLSGELREVFDVPLATAESFGRLYNEHYLWLHSVKRWTGSDACNVLDWDQKSLNCYHRLLAERFVIYNMQRIGVRHPFSQKGFLNKKMLAWTNYNHFNWRLFYHTYCSPLRMVDWLILIDKKRVRFCVNLFWRWQKISDYFRKIAFYKSVK